MKPLPLTLLLTGCLISGLRAQAPLDPAPTPREDASYSTAPEAFKPLGRKLVTNILLDQKAIWTSPFHMKRSNAKWWLLFGGVTAGLIATDRWTSRQLPNTKDQVNVASHVSDLGSLYTVAPLTAGFYLVGALTDNAKARETGLLGAEALVDGAILFEGFKLATRRQRPFEGDGNGRFFHGGDSFPSGHALESFALASVIAHEYRHKKVVPVIAYGLAALVSASRLSARQHFASDIVAAGAAGWFVGTYVFQTHQNKSRTAMKAVFSPQVRPDIRPASHSYGVALAWHP
jgi:membrane-associated phospholipid phosphatase